MTEDVIPTAIREFIDRHIDSVAQLEALVLLCGDPEASWDAVGTASRLYISAEEAAGLLRRLASDGFLIRSGDRYRFGCRTPEARDSVKEIAEFYARHLIPVTRLIHSKPDRIRQFADAFRLRRES